MHVLDNCKLDLIVSFMKQEIENGTEASRTFCYMWLIQSYGNEPGRAARKRGLRTRAALRQRVMELADVIADNLDTPGVARIANLLIPDDKESRTIRNQLIESTLGKKLKRLATRGDVQQRFMLYELALRLLEDDPEVVDRYQQDLLDPTLNNVVLNDLNGRPAHGTVGRTKLFYALFGYTASTAESADVEEEKWTARQSKLLMDLADGVMANGDSQLKFSDEQGVYSGMEGMQDLNAVTFEVNGYRYTNRTKPTFEVVHMMLPNFHKLGLKLSAANKKSMFVPKLSALKQFLMKRSDEAQDGETPMGGMEGMGGGGAFGGSVVNSSRVLEDLDYLVKLFNGDSTTKMPKDSLFQPRGGGGTGGGGVF